MMEFSKGSACLFAESCSPVPGKAADNVEQTALFSGAAHRDRITEWLSDLFGLIAKEKDWRASVTSASSAMHLSSVYIAQWLLLR